MSIADIQKVQVSFKGNVYAWANRLYPNETLDARQIEGLEYVLYLATMSGYLTSYPADGGYEYTNDLYNG